MSLKRAIVLLDVEGAPKVKLTFAAIEVSGFEFAHMVATAAGTVLGSLDRQAGFDFGDLAPGELGSDSA